jgi:hypothetical protein
MSTLPGISGPDVGIYDNGHNYMPQNNADEIVEKVYLPWLKKNVNWLWIDVSFQVGPARSVQRRAIFFGGSLSRCSPLLR